MVWELLRSVGGQGDERLCLWRPGTFRSNRGSPTRLAHRPAGGVGSRGRDQPPHNPVVHGQPDREAISPMRAGRMVRQPPTRVVDAQKNCAQGAVDDCLE
jgi:hypothetical protein